MTRPVAVPRVIALGPRETTRVAVLDVGSSSMSCLVAEMRPVHGAAPLRTHRGVVLAHAQQKARGIKSGLVVDARAAAETIRILIDKVEQEARASVSSVILSTSCGRLRSEKLSADVPLPHGRVRDVDVRQVFTAAARIASGGERVTLHALPVGFALDDHHGIVEPVGMRGNALTADMHLVTAEAGPISNLVDCVESCQLDVGGIVAAPYASALSVLFDDEIEHGATVIDLGGGATGVACFAAGDLTHVDAIALGGDHVTRDVGRVMRLTMSEAERLKVLQGNAFAPVSDLGAEDAFDVDELTADVRLGEAVRARAEEKLGLLKQRLDQNAPGGSVERIVLTGGGSQLAGIAELTHAVFGVPVRIGRPHQVYGSDSATTPGAAAVTGLLHYTGFASRERFGDGADTGSAGYWSRFGDWLREGF